MRILVTTAFALFITLHGCIAPSAAENSQLRIAGFPPETPITVQLPDGSVYQVPAAYLSPWPVRKFFGQTNHWKSLSFSFWMPEKRFLERDPFFIDGPRPREEGRPLPDPDQYVVNVSGVVDVSKQKPYPFFPLENQLSNIINIYSRNIDSNAPILTKKKRHIHGLTQLITIHKFQHDFFYNNFNDNFQVILDCDRDDGFLYNFCRCDIYLKEENIYMFMFFTRDKLDKWRENILTAKAFINQWKRNALTKGTETP